MHKSLKKPTTFKEQVHTLASKNIEISDVAQCEHFLSQANYYRLSGYLLPYIDKNTERCLNKVSFDTIRSVYLFDAELRNLIFKTIEKIEIYNRTQLAYYSAHTYGADGYLNASNYNPKHNHIAFTSHINRCIADNDKSPVVKHHILNYGGVLPIWVIVDYFTLGTLSYFYTGLKNKDKKYLSKSMYGVNFLVLSSWLRCLTDLRNRCAHYSRLYYWKFPAIPKIPKGDPFKADRTLFSQIYMLKLMYPDKSAWESDFLTPLVHLMTKYRHCISREHIGFPYRWRYCLLIHDD